MLARRWWDVAFGSEGDIRSKKWLHPSPWVRSGVCAERLHSGPQVKADESVVTIESVLEATQRLTGAAETESRGFASRLFKRPELRLRELLGFMRAFGVAPGAKLWGSMKLQLLQGDVLTLRVPGLSAPLHLRRQDLPIFDQILVDQEDDFTSYAQAGRVEGAYRDFLAEGKRPVILDCGGHVGFSAVWFASRFPEAVVYSIEPEAENFRLLEANAAAFGNIVPLRGGVWNRECHLRITNPGAVSAAFRVQETNVDLTCPASSTLRGYTVDEIWRRDEANRLLLVKIDVEGAEAQVFEEPAQWLGETAAVVIELHDWLLPNQRTSRNFLRQVAAYDFDIIPRGEKLLLFRA